VALPKWVFLIILLPVMELYVLIQVGGLIGAWTTIALVLLTAIVGVALLRLQGLSTLARGLRRLDEGQIPAGEMVEGMLLAVAGGFLLTPGFLTDVVGFLLLVPAARVRLSRALLNRLQAGPGSGGSPSSRAPGRVIEGEYERRNDDEPPRG
jgi:UPF0716 protein FxsA